VARLGTVLLVAGLLAMVFGGLWWLGLVPGSRVTLPEPVALQRATPGRRDSGVALQRATPGRRDSGVLSTPLPHALATRVPTTQPSTNVEPSSTNVEPSQPLPTLEPTPVALPALVPAPPTSPPAPTPTPAPIHLAAADADDRASAIRPPPGYAVRLTIPAINVDTIVKQGGIVEDADGQPVWETLPFVAVHYGDLTSMIGAFGNAVIVGHVVTLSEGNVFRSLYKLDIDDQINVWDDNSREHDFHVVDIKLVPPSDTSVMLPTPDETLTLITCGGTFDPVKRQFSERLIVTAKPLD
jgi:LPXTG-site transpeptidase (sortase) family protein